jgi:hypothetical protein
MQENLPGEIMFKLLKKGKVMGIANQAVQTGTLSMPHPEYSYITLASPGRLYSAQENLFEPPGFEPAFEQTEAKALTYRLRPQNILQVVLALVKAGVQFCILPHWAVRTWLPTAAKLFKVLHQVVSMVVAVKTAREECVRCDTPSAGMPGMCSQEQTGVKLRAASDPKGESGRPHIRFRSNYTDAITNEAGGKLRCGAF